MFGVSKLAVNKKKCIAESNMVDLQFGWDKAKAVLNYQKHSVTFEEAKTVFYDDDARLITDPDHSQTEDRFIIIGLSRALRVLVVVHCYRNEESVIRIITARKATKPEALSYWNNKL